MNLAIASARLEGGSAEPASASTRTEGAGGVAPGMSRPFDAGNFLFPRDLRVTPTAIGRVLLIGSCLSELYLWSFRAMRPDIRFDHLLFNNLTNLPEQPPAPPREYDFAYLQIPVRTIVTDRIILQAADANDAFFDDVLAEGCGMLDAMLEAGLAYNRRHGMLTLVSTFLVPQMDVVPAIDARRASSDLAALFRRLNDHLAAALRRYSNAFLVDIDALASSVGKRFFLDDVTGFFAHGSTFQQDDVDLEPRARIEPVPPMDAFYESKAQDFLAAVFEQAEASYRTIRQIDPVKAVIFDLDNTLWRGQIAEDYTPEKAPWPRGGWQNGIWEAIQQIRARGILVAICSKNDEATVRAYWNNVVDPPFIRIEDFDAVRIDYRPKAESIEEICRGFKLTAASVLFVDDNPVERAAAAAALPGLRTIGSNPYLTRRILLWAPEMQLARRTDEAMLRSASIRSQVRRDASSKALGRDGFLASLGTLLAGRALAGSDDPDFGRALELLNKTNQFNTTGRRWTFAELGEFIVGGGSALVFRVEDRFARYGLVALVLLRERHVEQFVMSCRVLGMEVEDAILAYLARTHLGVFDRFKTLTLRFVETSANMPCRDFLAKVGTAEGEGEDSLFRTRALGRVAMPRHVTLAGP